MRPFTPLRRCCRCYYLPLVPAMLFRVDHADRLKVLSTAGTGICRVFLLCTACLCMYRIFIIRIDVLRRGSAGYRYVIRCLTYYRCITVTFHVGIIGKSIALCRSDHYIYLIFVLSCYRPAVQLGSIFSVKTGYNGKSVSRNDIFIINIIYEPHHFEIQLVRCAICYYSPASKIVP